MPTIPLATTLNLTNQPTVFKPNDYVYDKYSSPVIIVLKRIEEFSCYPKLILATQMKLHISFQNARSLLKDYLLTLKEDEPPIDLQKFCNWIKTEKKTKSD